MFFDLERIHKSTRRVAKFLRKNSKRPSSDAVHQLRTSTRSLETTFSTLGLGSKRMVRQLLRDLGDVRKRAGKVRDMDVLTADTLSVRQDGEQDCLVQLLEYLGAERTKHVKRLRRMIKAGGGHLRRNLKRSSKRLEKLLERAQDEGPMDTDMVPTTMARTIKLSAELNIPPSAIGEWHDWEELIAIAKRLLDHGPACKLIKDLHENSNSKYERALFITGRFRSKYLESGRHKRRTRSDKIAPFSVPVLRATSAIAQ